MGNKIFMLEKNGYSINHRLSELEQTVANYSKKNDSFVCTSLLLVEGYLLQSPDFRFLHIRHGFDQVC